MGGVQPQPPFTHMLQSGSKPLFFVCLFVFCGFFVVVLGGLLWFFFSFLLFVQERFPSPSNTARRRHKVLRSAIKQALGETPEGDGGLSPSLPQRDGMFLEDTSQSNQLLGSVLE